MARPGHTPMTFVGTELIEFTSTEEFNRTIEVVWKNFEAASAGG